ncbi:3-hydroxyisobutyrate dehydrogenase [Hydrogenivirga caldilitoris]|uniref:3-hydroxyisobutyrate dehydrogenase n=1 Tax=Hydrogenivirga caldilitoris TaxID=246264 RepID=A0A497XT28_9AQUI|nr:NAD(P)-dependent oxidoreductase [Hydrogenivirga caldilitoris]RLJ71421.1 3-hydroxyisobutyrate dehydrogenase [Hydrogenivirga caldilitoris]
MKAGFIGLGHLGRAIAKRLIEQGVELVVWNRTRQKAEDFAKETGAKVAESPAELIKEVDRVFVIVFDSQASERVIFGEEGFIHGDIKGKTVIDMTTNHFTYAKLAYDELRKLGAHYLDAPVLGSVIPAQRGELTIVVGGDKDKFEENKPLFEKFCKNIFYVGEAGKATKVKLVNNIVLGGIMDILAEAIAIAERAGIPKEQFIEILETGAGKSYILDVKKKKLLEEDFSTHFSADLIYKDLHYAQDLVKELGLFSFTTAAIKETYGLAKAEGLGELDFSVIYKLIKEKGGKSSP